MKYRKDHHANNVLHGQMRKDQARAFHRNTLQRSCACHGDKNDRDQQFIGRQGQEESQQNHTVHSH